MKLTALFILLLTTQNSFAKNCSDNEEKLFQTWNLSEGKASLNDRQVRGFLQSNEVRQATSPDKTFGLVWNKKQSSWNVVKKPAKSSKWDMPTGWISKDAWNPKENYEGKKREGVLYGRRAEVKKIGTDTEIVLTGYENDGIAGSDIAIMREANDVKVVLDASCNLKTVTYFTKKSSKTVTAADCIDILKNSPNDLVKATTWVESKTHLDPASAQRFLYSCKITGRSRDPLFAQMLGPVAMPSPPAPAGSEVQRAVGSAHQ